MAVWSGVNVAGVKLGEMDPNFATGEDSDKWANVHSEVINRLGISCKQAASFLFHSHRNVIEIHIVLC